jgi:hypothetical protein
MIVKSNFLISITYCFFKRPIKNTKVRSSIIVKLNNG